MCRTQHVQEHRPLYRMVLLFLKAYVGQQLRVVLGYRSLEKLEHMVAEVAL